MVGSMYSSFKKAVVRARTKEGTIRPESNPRHSVKSVDNGRVPFVHMGSKTSWNQDFRLGT